MSIQHAGLAAGRWQTFSFAQQMGNIGSEVSRCIRHKNAHQEVNMHNALARALELIDLTIQDPRNRTRLRELTRIREVFTDHILGEDQYCTTDESWSGYFLAFGYAARRSAAFH